MSRHIIRVLQVLILAEILICIGIVARGLSQDAQETVYPEPDASAYCDEPIYGTDC